MHSDDMKMLNMLSSQYKGLLEQSGMEMVDDGGSASVENRVASGVSGVFSGRNEDVGQPSGLQKASGVKKLKMEKLLKNIVKCHKQPKGVELTERQVRKISSIEHDAVEVASNIIKKYRSELNEINERISDRSGDPLQDQIVISDKSKQERIERKVKALESFIIEMGGEEIKRFEGAIERGVKAVKPPTREKVDKSIQANVVEQHRAEEDLEEVELLEAEEIIEPQDIEIEEEIVEFEVERGRPREIRERAGPQIAQIEELVDEEPVDEELVVENENLDIPDDMEDLGRQNQPGRGG